MTPKEPGGDELHVPLNLWMTGVALNGRMEREMRRSSER